MTQRLPSLPNLGHLKKQAKDVLRVSRHRGPQWRLADAQHAVAHGYGFPSWSDLKRHVESVRHQRGAESSDPQHLRSFRASAGQSHPIAGTWATRRSAPSGDASTSLRAGRAQPPMGDMVVEFELIDDTVTLTQVAVDPAGRQSATKTAVQVDGQDHPIQFGDELVLQATWTDARTLEMIFKHDGSIVSTWTYAVSVDGQSHIVSTAEHVVIFERV